MKKSKATSKHGRKKLAQEITKPHTGLTRKVKCDKLAHKRDPRALNAVGSGLFTSLAHLPQDDRDELRAITAALMEDMQPETIYQHQLVQLIAWDMHSEGASIASIARAVGKSRVTIYAHLGGK